MIRLDHVTWTYPHADQPSLRDISLHVRAGEFVILCGASGSGKSTALRLMNGLIPHFHDDGILTGSVVVDGLVTADAELDEIGLVTGTVLQHPRRQFFADTAPEEIAFAMENFGVPTAEIRTRVGEALAGLAANVPIGQRLRHLSGGQQQQVAIAAATAHRPRLLLLDEPSSNLSADAVQRLARRLGELKAQGVTIVIAEHRLRYLRDLVDRVVVVRDGRIDVEWPAERFRAVTDAELAHEGLRGEPQPVDLPFIPAAGRSILRAGAADPAEDVPASSVFEAGGFEPGVLELENIVCRLGGRTIIDIERAVFAAGEVTAIRGVNGAGKTTLARILTGLQRSRGRVRLGGRVLSRGGRQRASAIVMQDLQRQLFTDSVAAEIELAAADDAGTHRDIPASDASADDAPASDVPTASAALPGAGTGIAPETHAVLASLDLADLAERHPLSLSGGQQQRLVVAAVRVAGRRLVVFDEPSSGVDRRHLRSISDQIRQVARDGAVVLLISHDDDLLALAADRQCILAPVGRAPADEPRA